MFSVKESSVDEAKTLLSLNGLEMFLEPIGRFMERKEKVIEVKL
jgi:hypothetical protein